MSTPASLRRRAGHSGGSVARRGTVPAEVVSRRLRSRRWRAANSSWLLMPALGGTALSWIAFLYMGLKGRKASWLLASLLYFLTTAATAGLFIAAAATTAEWLAFIGVLLAFAGWGGGLVHSIMANPTWLRIKAALGLEAEVPPAPVVPPAPPSPGEVVARLQEDLRGLVRRVNAAGGRLPDGAVPKVREIEDVLRPLLARAQKRTPNVEEMHNLEAIVREYLPSAVDRYLDLPEQYALTGRTSEGTTPAEELLKQLGLLHEGALQLQHAVYDSDAQALTTQGRFLDAKFRRSDLDL
ncbi:hypothetical protein CLV92_106190 [Kineococcus xinjiangensis]|uniref:5-bromo-4-chloroindolyl phosphate hydrolysis protein n=1 Tax=Kineococcus xinjiangensis TaxID=512762 RepID=A0A2S6IMD2_9ACTN|nr:hypothetical protein [Kineococcus xinjiangensis]PPK95369.1 hypothetical protein CLV92_106190 [Kineococcus xinjiangensis]